MESICKHCKQTFEISTKSKGWMANHSRWCTFNPKRKEYDDFLKQRREIFVTSKEILDKRSQAVKDAWKRGSYDGIDHGKGFRGKEHSEESKSKISKGALNSNHRRLRKNPIGYKGVMLDSTWELELAKRLDHLKIKWVRPEPLKWIDDNGFKHNYFPDFYLPEYNVYLDPKNPHAFNIQIDKINILNQIYNIKWILTLEECINFKI